MSQAKSALAMQKATETVFVFLVFVFWYLITGSLLVSQAKSALAMQKATETVQQKMKKHKADVSETLFL